MPRRQPPHHQQRRRCQPHRTHLCIVLLACCRLVIVAQSLSSVSTAAANVRPSLGQTASLGRRLALRAGLSRRAAAAAPTAARMGETSLDGRKRTMVAIGGGAAGYFGAVQGASSSGGKLEVVVLEAGRLPLQKVKVSGGGRCNVMHDTSKAVSLIAQGYPRGSKQLIGPFNSLFGPSDAAAWFRARGVKLKTEGDGRMFPVTDDSQTVIDCLERAAKKAGVQVITSARVTSISSSDRCATSAEGTLGDVDAASTPTSGEDPQPRFEVNFSTATPLSAALRKTLGAVVATEAKEAAPAGGADGDEAVRATKRISYKISCDYVLQATGAAREGHAWAKKLGHAVSAPVPSLFTLTVKDPRLSGLAGLSVQDAELKLFASEPKGAGKGEAAAAGKRSHDVQGERDGAGSGGGAAKAKQPAAGNAARTETAEFSGDAEKASSKKGNRKKKKAKGITQRGPLLVTHTGLSGPAALKLSAFGARELSEGGYKGRLLVNWLAGSNPSKTLEELQAFRTRNPKKTVYAFCPLGAAGSAGDASVLPRRLWQSLALAAGVAGGDKWADVSKAKLSALAQQLTACDLQIVGKGSFKEEFVTCGGVALSALDMRTMESRSAPGLFFAGEVVDIDGVTGGFNFQSAWTTGWVAGSAIGARAAAVAAGSEESQRADGDTRPTMLRLDSSPTGANAVGR